MGRTTGALLLAAALPLAGTLAGCGEELPGCDSSSIAGLVEQTFRQTLAKGKGADAVDIAASHIALSDVKQLSGSDTSRTCVAHTRFTVAPKDEAAKAEAATVAANWQYTSIEWGITPSTTKGNIVVEILKAQ